MERGCHTHLSPHHVEAHSLEEQSKASESDRPTQPLTNQDYGEGIIGDIYKAPGTKSGIEQAILIAANLTR